jgi:hypothetical protein
VGLGPRALENMVSPSRAIRSGKLVSVTGHTCLKGAWVSLWLVVLGAGVSGYARQPDGANLYSEAVLDRIITSVLGNPRDTGAVADNLKLAERVGCCDETYSGGNLEPPDIYYLRPVPRLFGRIAARWGSPPARYQFGTATNARKTYSLRVNYNEAVARLGWSPRPPPLEKLVNWTIEWSRQWCNGEPAAFLLFEQIDRCLTSPNT